MVSLAATTSMPTSATGTSTERRFPATARRSAGFTLLELLVVVTIVGVFVGAAVLSIGITGDARAIEREAFRFTTLLDLVREEALMQNRDYGLQFSESGYRFYLYDYLQLAWLEPAADELLAAYDLGAELSVALRLEDREVELEPGIGSEGVDVPRPQILILSTGEMTPFEATLYRDLDGAGRVVRAGFDGTLEILDDEPPIR